MRSNEELKDGFKLGDWTVLPDEGTIRRGEEVVKPEPQTLRVLLALARRDGKLVTRQDLIDEVWGGRPTTDEPITRAIREVRKCFGDSASDPAYVETLHRRGYRLLQPVVIETNDKPPQRMRLVAAVAAGVAGIVLAVWYSTHTPDDIVLPSSRAPANSIAVLPFKNLSGDDSNAYIVSGLKVALVHAIAGMNDRVVKNGGVEYAMEPEDIAERLGVESVITGALQRDGDRLLVHYEISVDGNVSVSESVAGNSGDLFELQEQLSRSVRSSLGGTLAPVMLDGHRPHSEAFDSYMRGRYALEYRGEPGNLEAAIELFQTAIDADPKYGPSYLGLATAYALMPDYRRSSQSQSPSYWNDKALATVAKGVERDPVIEDAAGAIYGFVFHKEKRWQESERAHRRAVNAAVVDSNAFNWYSRMLASVGLMDDALEMALQAVEIDPTSAVINSRIAINYTWLQDRQKAHEYFERSNELGAAGVNHLLAYAFLLSRDGDLEQARSVTMEGMKKSGQRTDWVAPVFAALADAGNIPAALRALDDATADGDLAPQIELTVRTLFGDIDAAMDIAVRLEEPGEYFEMDLLYIPELIALRQHPDFMPLLDRLGVSDYWQSRGCSWADDKVHCPHD